MNKEAPILKASSNPLANILLKVITFEKTLYSNWKKFIVGPKLSQVESAIVTDTENNQIMISVKSNLESIAFSSFILGHELLFLIADRLITHEKFYVTYATIVAASYFCFSAVANNRVYGEDYIDKKVDTVGTFTLALNTKKIASRAVLISSVSLSVGLLWQIAF